MSTDPSTDPSPDPSTEAEDYDGGSVDDETQLQPEDTLIDRDPATGVDDQLDRGYSAPEKWSAGQGYGNTPWEAAHDRPLDDRLSEEQPDVGPGGAEEPAPAEDDGLAHDADEVGTEVGGRRAGRLVADTDEFAADDAVDHDQDVMADDVGVDGAAASAEEAAMHVIEDDEA